MHIIPVIIVCIYVVILYLISWYSSILAKKDGVEGYLLAGRGFPTVVVAVALAGLAVGGASTVGVAQNAYKAGISAGMYNAAWGAGGILVGLIGASRLRQLMISTVPELLGQYFGPSARVIGVIGQLIIQITITSLQYVAGGAILTALLPQFFTMSSGMLTTAIVFVGITILGGMWASGLTNIINVIVIYVGIIVGVISSISHVGGMGKLVLSLPAQGHWFDPVAGMGIAIVGAWFAVMITQALSVQGVIQIAFAAKDGKAARNGFILGGILILPVGFLSAVFGIVAAAQFPGIPTASVLPQVVLTLNPFVAGFTLAGLWAADVSTASVLLIGSSTLIVEDIWKRYFQPNLDSKQSIMASRIIVLLVSVLTYILATTVVGILQTLTVGLTLTSAYTLILLFTMFAPRFCRKSSAFWTILTGIIYLLIWQFVPATHIVPHAIYLAWPVALVTFFAVYVLDRRPAEIPVKAENNTMTLTH